MDTDTLTSMYAQIVLGVLRDESPYVVDDESAGLWDEISAEVSDIRAAHPAAEFEIPFEGPPDTGQGLPVAAVFDESKHPRDSHGRFGKKPGGKGGKSKKKGQVIPEGAHPISEYKMPGFASLNYLEEPSEPIGDPHASSEDEWYDNAGNDSLNFFGSPEGYLFVQAVAKGKPLPGLDKITDPDQRDDLVAAYNRVVDDIDNYIEDFDVGEPVSLWREMEVSTPKAMELAQPGTKIHQKGFCSTTCRKNEAVPYGLYGQHKDVIVKMHILVPEGAHAAPGEYGLTEWILPRDTTMQVRKAEPGGAVTILDPLDPSLPLPPGRTNPFIREIPVLNLTVDVIPDE